MSDKGPPTVTVLLLSEKDKVPIKKLFQEKKSDHYLIFGTSDEKFDELYTSVHVSNKKDVAKMLKLNTVDEVLRHATEVNAKTAGEIAPGITNCDFIIGNKNLDYKEILKECFGHMLKIAGTKDADMENYRDMISNLIDTKEFPIRIIEDETTIKGSKKRKFDDFVPDKIPAPARKPPAKIADVPFDMDEVFTDNNSLVTFVQDFDKGISYNGFNPDLVRKKFIDLYKSDSVKGAYSFSKNLVVMFSIYDKIGNNTSKLGKKRLSEDIANKAIKHLAGTPIMKKATKSDSMTLPRLAISFMPEYLIWRKFISKDLQNQTSSKLGVEYKDVAFRGYDGISSLAEYSSFNLEFGSFIYNSGKGVEMSDKAFLKDQTRWDQVATTGYNNDLKVHIRMKEAFEKTEPFSAREAIEWINGAESLPKYLEL